MTLTERDATAADATPETGVDSYRVVDPMDRTGRMTVKSTDGTTYTVVGTGDARVSRRLRDRAPGATVRLELGPAPSDTGHVAVRVKAGGLPPL
ncbi:MAG: hypothetical protein V5A44_08090 [Haloarculaceae archaeon]